MRLLVQRKRNQNGSYFKLLRFESRVLQKKFQSKQVIMNSENMKLTIKISGFKWKQFLNDL
jgi:hypothetical protein